MSGIICYENVDICYNGSPVIKKVSFSAEKGEILGIAGESGSGKSTLIKAAIGLLGKNGSVTGGKIWYEEKKLLDLNAKELRKICGSEIGMIFQNAGSSFCPIRTVGEQLLEGPVYICPLLCRRDTAVYPGGEAGAPPLGG